MEVEEIVAKLKGSPSSLEFAELRLKALELAIEKPGVWADKDWQLFLSKVDFAETRLHQMDCNFIVGKPHSCSEARFDGVQIYLEPHAGFEWAFFATKCLVSVHPLWFAAYDLMFPKELAYLNGYAVPNLQSFIESQTERVSRESERDLLRTGQGAGSGVQNAVDILARIFRRS